MGEKKDNVAGAEPAPEVEGSSNNNASIELMEVFASPPGMVDAFFGACSIISRLYQKSR